MEVDTRAEAERDQLRVKRKTLEAVLHQCQRALQSIGDADCAAAQGSPAPCPDKEADEVSEFLSEFRWDPVRIVTEFYIRTGFSVLKIGLGGGRQIFI